MPELGYFSFHFNNISFNSNLHKSICCTKLVLRNDKSTDRPEGAGQQAVGHTQDHHCYVGVEQGEVEQSVAADGDEDREEDPGDVPACLVDHQAQHGGGWSGDQVDQPDDLVGFLVREGELGDEEVLGQGDKGEDGSIVGKAGQGEKPEGDGEIPHIPDIDHLL